MVQHGIQDGCSDSHHLNQLHVIANMSGGTCNRTRVTLQCHKPSNLKTVTLLTINIFSISSR